MIAAILSFFSGAWGKIAAAGAVVLTILAAFLKVRQDGKDAAQAEIAAKIDKQSKQANQAAQEVQNDVARKTDDAVSDALKSGWVRK